MTPTKATRAPRTDSHLYPFQIVSSGSVEYDTIVEASLPGHEFHLLVTGVERLTDKSRRRITRTLLRLSGVDTPDKDRLGQAQWDLLGERYVTRRNCATVTASDIRENSTGHVWSTVDWSHQNGSSNGHHERHVSILDVTELDEDPHQV